MRLFVSLCAAMLMAGCAGVRKDWAQTNASAYGADWIVVQYAFDGRPFHCWKLTGASLDSETGGSINWQDTTHRHLMHVTGWENRVQVVDGDFATAARLLGVEAEKCGGGIYPMER